MAVQKLTEMWGERLAREAHERGLYEAPKLAVGWEEAKEPGSYTLQIEELRSYQGF